MAQVVALPVKGPLCRGDWTNGELAELLRVEHALLRAQVAVICDRGATDEGDPWFVFCRDDGTVLVHIARFDGLYRLYSPVLTSPLVGRSFSEITKSFAASLSKLIGEPDGRVRRPVALLSVLVATIFLLADEFSSAASAASLGGGELSASPARGGAASTPTIASLASTAGGGFVVAIELVALFAMLSPDATQAAADVADLGGNDLISDARHLDSPVGGEGVTHVLSSTIATDGDDTGTRDLVVSKVEAEYEPRCRQDEDTEESGGTETPSVAEHRRGGVSLEGASDVRRALARASEIEEVTEPPREPLVTDDGAVTVRGYAALHLTITEGAHQAQVELLEGAIADIVLSVPEAVLQPLVQLTLDGSAIARLHLGEGVESIQLSIASEGEGENAVDLSYLTISDSMQLSLTGEQDLIVTQSAKVHNHSRIDALALSGQLLYAVDLGAPQANAVELTFDRDSFAVRSDSSLALLNLKHDAHIDVGADLKRVLIQTAPEDIGTDVALNLSLHGQAGKLTIGLLSATKVSALGIDAGADHSSIGIIEAPLLSKLILTGNGALGIDGIVGFSGGLNHDLVIDATALHGSLALDLHDLPDASDQTVHLIRSPVSIGDGSPNSGYGVSDREATTVETTIDGTHYVLAGLRLGDLITLGRGNDEQVISSLVGVDSSVQVQIDGQATLEAAAAMAGTTADIGDGAQSLLFSYKGEHYFFTDIGGDHVFQAEQDALVKLVGVASEPVTL